MIAGLPYPFAAGFGDTFDKPAAPSGSPGAGSALTEG